MTKMLLLVLCLLPMTLVVADFDFQDGEPHGVIFALTCDFKNFDLTNVRAPGENCGWLCRNNPDCTHWAWSNFEGGTCWLKRKIFLQGFISKADAIFGSSSSSCGMDCEKSHLGVDCNNMLVKG